MAKWISLNKAARKYGVKTEDVRIWAEIKEIAAYRTKESFIVDDESIEEFLSRVQKPPTKDYIFTLLQICENNKVLCDTFFELLSAKDHELEMQQEKITRLEKIISKLEKCNKKVLDIIDS